MYEGDATGETYTVKLATEPTGNVTVVISGHTGTDLSLDKTSLTFTTINWETARDVTVTAGRDDDSTDDSVTLTHTASGGGYNSIGKTLAVTILDNTPASVAASFDQATYTVPEGGNITVKVNLSEDPKRTVTIPLTHAGQDGASSTDYSGVPGNLTFHSGDTEKSFTLAATQDKIDEDGESVRLTFDTLPTGVTQGGTKRSHRQNYRRRHRRGEHRPHGAYGGGAGEQQLQGGAGQPTHRGRDCHHQRRRDPPFPCQRPTDLHQRTTGAPPRQSP